MELAVIGAGAMGRWFADFGLSKDWGVTMSDLDNNRAKTVANDLGLKFARGKEEAVEGADLVMVSVPIKETPGVVEEVSKYLDEDVLLFDIASVKEGVVKKMKGLGSKSEMVSIHPLFGPGAGSLEEKNVVVVPVKPGEIYGELKGVFSEEGANLVEMGADEHDRIMSVTQSLTHFTLLSYYSALDSMDRVGEAEELQTPMFQNLISLAKAFMSEEPALCGDIQTENKYASEARSSLRKACMRLDEALRSGDIGPVEEVFDRARESIDPEEIESAYEKIYESTEGGS